jgi:GNAT superfamily N-acetyltransferase
MALADLLRLLGYHHSAGRAAKTTTSARLNADTGVMIRAARSADLPALRDVEQAAGAMFHDLGMTAVADDEPPSLAELATYQQDGRAWVVTDDADRPVAYLLVDVVDTNAHVEQVSVHPDHTRQGLGKALLDTAAAWARQRGLAALTLTTYVEVPWNAPYYRRLGFQVIPDAQLTGGLRRLREHEQARGLDTWPRVVMRRPVGDQDQAR